MYDLQEDLGQGWAWDGTASPRDLRLIAEIFYDIYVTFRNFCQIKDSLTVYKAYDISLPIFNHEKNRQYDRSGLL